MIKVKRQYVGKRVVTDIFSDVSLVNFGVCTGDLFRIHCKALLELKSGLQLFGGIVENNGIIHCKGE